jgi:hypothetical protein
LGAPVSGVDQIARDIDTHYVRSEFRRGQCGRAIATAEIQYLKSFRDSKSLHESRAAFAHGVGDAREIAFFPKCFVWINRSIHDAIVSSASRGRNLLRGAHASTRAGDGVLTIANF